MRELRTSLEKTPRARRAWLAVVAIWSLVLALGIAAALDPLHSLSVDLAHHGALVARLLYDGHVVAGDPSLGEMASYPRGAHAAAAFAGGLAGSSIAGMQWIAIGALALVWTALATGLLLLEGRARILAVAGAILGVAACRIAGIELFGNELAGNYHFAQLVAQSIAVAAIVASAALERSGMPVPVLRLGTALVACLLVDVHLLPALELLGATILLGMLDVCRARPRQRLRAAALLVAWIAIAAAYVAWHPTLRTMREIAENNGATALRLVHDFADLGVLLGVTLSVSATTLLTGLRPGSPRDSAGSLARHLGAAGLAAAGLCLLQLVAWTAWGAGSPYAVYKYVLALQTFALFNAIVLLATAWRTKGSVSSTLWRAGSAIAAAALPWMALHALHGAPLATASIWSKAEREARGIVAQLPPMPAGTHAYVHGVTAVTPIGDYFLTIALLRTPRDRNTLDVLQGRSPASDPASVGWLIGGRDASQGIDEECVRDTGDLVAVDLACTTRDTATTCSGTWALSSPRFGERELHGFSHVEPDGRWTAAPVAMLTCTKDAHGTIDRITLDVSALVTDRHGQRLVLRADDGPATTWSFDLSTPARSIEIVPPPSTSETLRLLLEIPDAASPEALGISTDSRLLGVKLHNVTFHAREPQPTPSR